jgi:hypothetical protein
MYHNYAEFNEKQLFLYFNGLQSEYTKKFPPNLNGFNEFDLLFEEFLFKADCFYSSLDRMNDLTHLIYQQFFDLQQIKFKGITGEEKQLTIPKKKLLRYNTILTNEFLKNLPPFLNLFFILQDRILRIVGLYLGLDNLPNKYPLFVKNANIIKRFGNYIEKASLRYWRDHAQTLRKYRNLDQHDYNLLFNYGINSEAEFQLILPDNPEEKMISRISFKENLNALDYFNQEFDAFHTYVEDIIKSMKISPILHSYGSFNENLDISPDYEDGDCMALFQVGKEAICLYQGKLNPETKGSSISTNKLPIKKSKLRIDIE